MNTPTFNSASDLKNGLTQMTFNGELKSLPVIKLGEKSYFAREKTMYVAAKLTDVISRGGSLIAPADKAQNGVTNYANGNMLPAGTAHYIKGIRVLFAKPAAATPVQAGEYDDAAPKEFLNGEIVISQSGNGVLFESSGSDVFNGGTPASNSDSFRAIPQGALLRPETSFEIKTALAGGTFTHELIRVELRVIELVEVNRA